MAEPDTVVTTEPSYIDDGLVATDERLALARRHWIEGKSSDFEQIGQRKWVDRATGHAYRRVSGSPLLNPSTPVDLWFRRHHELIFLARSDRS